MGKGEISEQDNWWDLIFGKQESVKLVITSYLLPRERSRIQGIKASWTDLTSPDLVQNRWTPWMAWHFLCRRHIGRGDTYNTILIYYSLLEDLDCYCTILFYHLFLNALHTISRPQCLMRTPPLTRSRRFGVDGFHSPFRTRIYRNYAAVPPTPHILGPDSMGNCGMKYE